MAKKRVLLIICIFAVCMAAAYFGYKALNQRTTPDALPQQESISIGEKGKPKAADFSVLDKDGKTVKLSDMKGTPIVLNFWASWCPPCKEEMPTFDKVAKEMGDNVRFMMVDLVDGQQETISKGKGHIKSEGYTFPVYFDTKQEGAKAYEVYSIPTTIFIDKDGFIIHQEKGAIDENRLKDGIAMIQ